MVVTLTGINLFLISQELDRLVNLFVKENGSWGLEYLDAEELDIEYLQKILLGVSLLATRKMIILRRGGRNKIFTEKVEYILNNLPRSSDLILVEYKIDKRSTYYKLLKKRTDVFEYGELDQYKLVDWLVRRARDNQADLKVSDAQYLIERVGNNQQLLSNELQKYVLYSAGQSQDDRMSISRKVIDLLSEPTPHSTIFNLLEAAFGGNRKLTMELYQEQRLLNVEPQQIISMITWQLYVLALIKTADDRTIDQIASEAGLNPYVLSKSSAVANKLKTNELQVLINSLLSIDNITKQLPVDTDEALKRYLFLLCR